jgi:hypothetical protein
MEFIGSRDKLHACFARLCEWATETPMHDELKVATEKIGCGMTETADVRDSDICGPKLHLRQWHKKLGRIDDMQQLQCCARPESKQRFPFNLTKEKPILPVAKWEKEMVADADVFVIVDCCYSTTAFRGGLDSSSTAKIIAACDEVSSSAPRTSTVSFIQKVAGAIGKQVRELTLLEYAS